MNKFEKYELCYKYYLKTCEMMGEKTNVTFDIYFDIVPLSQIEDMLKCGYVGSAKIEEEAI